VLFADMALGAVCMVRRIMGVWKFADRARGYGNEVSARPSKGCSLR
jgi:hypothetical protein